jgi:hypothetical protein
VVEEEETECDKSIVEETVLSDITHPMNEESHEEEDESVVIKRPMSSKKSKSLENINKINRGSKHSDKALLEIYKQ